MRQSFVTRLAVAAALALVVPAASAQGIDMKLLDKWNAVKIIRFDVVGEIADKHVQIPPTDADLYADVSDRVVLSFYWDKGRQAIVGTPKFRNEPARVSNLTGMEKGCPSGEINGRYEHFELLRVEDQGRGTVKLVGERIHPETQVAESCGKGRRKYAGAVRPVDTFIAPPDVSMFAYRAMMPPNGPTRFSADGASIITTAQNNHWVWTFTPSPVTKDKDGLEDLQLDR